MIKANSYFNPLKIFFMLLFIIVATTACQPPPQHAYSNGFVYQFITHNHKLYVNYTSKGTGVTIGSRNDTKSYVFDKLRISEESQLKDLVMIYDQNKIQTQSYPNPTPKDCVFERHRSKDSMNKVKSPIVEQSEASIIRKKERDEPLDPVITVKDPINDNILYRLFKKEKIEQSLDNGDTWKTVWSPPIGRQHFISRYRYSIMCLGPSEPGPYDLSFTPDGSMLIVTMGTEGIMAMTRDGTWKKYSVLDARPTPHTTFSLANLFELITNELLVLLFILLIVSLTLYSFVWKFIKVNQKNTSDEIIHKQLGPLKVYYYIFIFSILIPLCIVFARHFRLLDDNFNIKFMAIFFLSTILIGITWIVLFIKESIRSSKNKDTVSMNDILGIMFFGGFFSIVSLLFFSLPKMIWLITPFNVLLIVLTNRYVWYRMIQLSGIKDNKKKLINIATLVFIGTFFIPLTILVLWTFGMIPWYELSLFLAISGVLFLWFKTARKANEMGLTLWKE